MAGSTDQFGVVARYATGAGTSDWSENFRDDGKRFDFDGLGSDYASCELRAYFSWDNPADDETAGKMGGGNHSSGTTPKCYIPAVDNRSGQTRLRTEEDHPSGYETVGNGGTGSGLGSAFIGFCFIKWNQSNGVRIEIWQDTGNNESAPSNQWRKIAEWLETDKNWQTPPSDHQETIRCDGNNGASGLRWKWIYLQRISGGDTGDGTGGGTPGVGGGGGLDPYGGFVGGGGSGGSNAIISEYIPTFADLNGDGYADQTGDFIGGTPNPNWSGGASDTDWPGSPQGPQPEEEIITVSKRYILKWSIRSLPESCNSASDTEASPIKELYTCPDGSNDPELSTLDMYNDGPCVKIGAYVALDTSMLIGDLVKEFIARVKRVGNPTGYCYWEIYDQYNQLVYQTPLDQMILASNVGLNYGDVTIQDFKNVRQLELFDKIVFCYGQEDGEGDIDNKLVYKFNEGDVLDGAKTCLVYFSGTKWYVDPAKDFSGKLGGTDKNA